MRHNARPTIHLRISTSLYLNSIRDVATTVTTDNAERAEHAEPGFSAISADSALIVV
jgi:hypothetical protein